MGYVRDGEVEVADRGSDCGVRGVSLSACSKSLVHRDSRCVCSSDHNEKFLEGTQFSDDLCFVK